MHQGYQYFIYSIIILTFTILVIGFLPGFVHAQDSNGSSATSIGSAAAQKIVINDKDEASNYARRIEILIAQKGETVRANMITIMQRFLANYKMTHPLYGTIERMINIIKIGEFAHKIEYCTQYEDSYRLKLFGIDIALRSTIKYNNALQSCIVTFTYPDRSVRTCQLKEEHKITLAQALIDKQGLYVSEGNSFEAVLDNLLKSKICTEQ